MDPFPALHALVAAVLQCARALEKKGDVIFRESGLTTQYFHILFLMAQSPEPMLASGLADELVTTRSNVTGILGRMEKAGLIWRQATPGDRRAAALSLTPAGRSAFRAGAKAYREHLESLERALSAGALPVAQDTLQRLIALTQ